MKKVPNQKKYDIILSVLAVVFTFVTFAIFEVMGLDPDKTPFQRIAGLCFMLLVNVSFSLLFSYQLARNGLYIYIVGCSSIATFIISLLGITLLIGPALGISPAIYFCLGFIVSGLLAYLVGNFLNKFSR